MPGSQQKRHTRSFNRFIEIGEAVILGKSRAESIARRKDGSEFPVEISVSQSEQTFIATISDISLRKKLEQEQDDVRQRMQQFFDVTLEGLFFHKDGIIIDTNKSGALLSNSTPEEVVGHSLFDYIPSEYHPLALERMQSGSSESWEAEFIRPDGSLTPIEVQGRDAEYLGKPVRVVAVRDISERKRAEKAIQNIADELRQLIETANAPIFGIDTHGQVSEWNKTAERITGYSKDEVIGKYFVSDFITDDYKTSVRDVLDRALQGDETENYEFPLYTKAGERLDILLNSSTRRNAEGDITGVIAVGQNITERKQAEAQVIQASKLASLGEMATSVAHELNQPLNVIRMAAGNSLRKIAKGDVEAEYLTAKLERIAAQTERAAAIITHMRMFGRKASEAPSQIDLCDVIQGALDMVGEQLRLAEIDVQKREPPETRPKVLGHQVLLEQVMLNLLTNARDAIEARDNLKEKKIRLVVENVDTKNVRIVVEDNAGGIPDSAIEHIFEPFYTTKEMGKGTGLGLSVSYGIIREMGGSIEACNIDQGARFTITLPIADTSVAAE